MKVKSADTQLLRGQRAFQLFPKERKFLAENLERLNTLYQGRYVAVVGNSVIDSDREFSALAERVYRKLGYRRIFMPFIERTRKVLRIPSPRIVR